MKYLVDFIEEVVIPAKEEFPIKYDLHNALVIEDIIEILEEQLETNRLLNVRHLYGGYILDMKTYPDDRELIISCVFDKKTLSFEVLYEGEYLTILDLNPEDNCYDVIDGLMQKIVAELW